MRKAKLFVNGRSQAVRLPKDLRFEGDEVFVERVGNAVVLLPLEDSWRTLFESLGAFSEDFMSERGQPERAEQREDIFGAGGV